MSTWLRLTSMIILLLFVSSVCCRGQDVDPRIEPGHISARDGRDVTVVFVAHSEEKGLCDPYAIEPVVSEQSPYSFHICSAASPSKGSSQPEYDLRMTAPSRPDSWFHMIITPKNDEEIDDQFVWSSFILKGTMDSAVQLRLPVHPRITTTYLNGDIPPTLSFGFWDGPFKMRLPLKSTLQKLNLRVTKIQPSVSVDGLGTVATRDHIAIDNPIEIPPRQSRDAVISVIPSGWHGATQGLWDLKPDQTDANITLSIESEPELGGVNHPQDLTIPVHIKAHPFILAVFLIAGTLAGVLVERLAVATPTQTVTPFMKTWLYGLLLSLVAWAVAALLPATASSTVFGVPISTSIPLDIFLLGFFLAGGRAVASKVTLS